jgi:hypothetical protein
MRSAGLFLCLLAILMYLFPWYRAFLRLTDLPVGSSDIQFLAPGVLVVGLGFLVFGRRRS